jgi:hypothetical protein
MCCAWKHKAMTMIIRRGALLLCLAIAACAVQPPPDTASVPFGAFGTMDNDVGAMNQATWAFALSARTLNNPVDAARAAAAVDYLAGELSSNPRWVTMSPLTKLQMLQARVDVRRALGIRPDAPSQLMVDALMRFAALWQSGNQPAAMQMLDSPVFTLAPPQTLQVLSNMPYIQSANIATMNASGQMDGDGGMRVP